MSKSKKNKRSLVKRTNNHKLAVIPKQDRLALAARKKGAFITSDPEYFAPVIAHNQIYWVMIWDKKNKTWGETPFVPYTAVLDNVHRRGVSSINVEHMPPISCKDSGCYMQSPGDLTSRCRATITLKNGMVFTSEGEACIHNTTRIAKSALRRVAETRAKARAGRDAVNIGVTCLVECSSIDGQVRVGDKILSESETEAVIVEGSVVQSKGDMVHVGSPSEVRKQEGEMPKEYNFKDERTKQNALLHGEFSRLGLDVKAAHAYIHRMDKVASLKDLDAAKLADWVNNFSQIRLDSPNHARIKEMVGGAGVKT